MGAGAVPPYHRRRDAFPQQNPSLVKTPSRLTRQLRRVREWDSTGDGRRVDRLGSAIGNVLDAGHTWHKPPAFCWPMAHARQFSPRPWPNGCGESMIAPFRHTEDARTARHHVCRSESRCLMRPGRAASRIAGDADTPTPTQPSGRIAMLCRQIFYGPGPRDTSPRRAQDRLGSIARLSGSAFLLHTVSGVFVRVGAKIAFRARAGQDHTADGGQSRLW